MYSCRPVRARARRTRWHLRRREGRRWEQARERAGGRRLQRHLRRASPRREQPLFASSLLCGHAHTTLLRTRGRGCPRTDGTAPSPGGTLQSCCRGRHKTQGRQGECCRQRQVRGGAVGGSRTTSRRRAQGGAASTAGCRAAAMPMRGCHVSRAEPHPGCPTVPGMSRSAACTGHPLTTAGRQRGERRCCSASSAAASTSLPSRAAAAGCRQPSRAALASPEGRAPS